MTREQAEIGLGMFGGVPAWRAAWERIISILDGETPPPTLTAEETATKPARERHWLDPLFDPTEPE